ncbi:MAG: SlyX family protein [Desulfovibrionales bacterium]|nr:SlyX family protein [Desulfovibrionales bacterium]
MNQRMEKLEIRYSYLQKTVDDLSTVVIEQQKEIQELRRLVILLGSKLREVSALQSESDPDEKPPHY